MMHSAIVKEYTSEGQSYEDSLKNDAIATDYTNEGQPYGDLLKNDAAMQLSVLLLTLQLS